MGVTYGEMLSLLGIVLPVVGVLGAAWLNNKHVKRVETKVDSYETSRMKYERAKDKMISKVVKTVDVIGSTVVDGSPTGGITRALGELRSAEDEMNDARIERIMVMEDAMSKQKEGGSA